MLKMSRIFFYLFFNGLQCFILQHKQESCQIIPNSIGAVPGFPP